MPAYRRNFLPGGTYFFTLVALRQALCEIRARHPFSIDAIVLLPDHLHTVWTLPPNDDRYPLRWRQIKTRFTQEYLNLGGIELDVSVSRKIKGERGVSFNAASTNTRSATRQTSNGASTTSTSTRSNTDW